ncbi:hypothetical protein Aduo_003048 [Ancylostoma duodenale]
MMNANATEVGCTFEKKGRLTSILCLYNSRVVLAQPFYQMVEDEVTTKLPEAKVTTKMSESEVTTKLPKAEVTTKLPESEVKAE